MHLSINHSEVWRLYQRGSATLIKISSFPLSISSVSTFMVPTSYLSLFILLLQTFSHHINALPDRTPDVSANPGVHVPYYSDVVAKATPKPSPPLAQILRRDNSSTFTTVSQALADSQLVSSAKIVHHSLSTSATTNRIQCHTLPFPFGIYIDIIFGITYTLTYVSTDAPHATTIKETDPSSTTTATYSSGAPIWAVPVLPIGFPDPPTPPPPAEPPEEGGDEGDKCKFGCDNSTSTLDDHSSRTSPKSITRDSQSSTISPSSLVSSTRSGITCSYGCSECNRNRHQAEPTSIANEYKREKGNLFQYSSVLKRNIPTQSSISQLYRLV